MVEQKINILNPKLSVLKLHKEASWKAKTGMLLAILGVWVPMLPSIAALFLAKSATREAPVNYSTFFLTKWGRKISWLFIILNIVGLLALIVIFTIAGDILAEACLTVDESYCVFVF